MWMSLLTRPDHCVLKVITRCTSVRPSWSDRANTPSYNLTAGDFPLRVTHLKRFREIGTRNRPRCSQMIKRKEITNAHAQLHATSPRAHGGMDSLVNEGVLVLIRKDGVCKPLRLKKERLVEPRVPPHAVTRMHYVSKVSLDKLSFFPDNALGRPYGSSYEVRGNQLVPKPTAAGVGIELTEEAAGSDNRGLACDGTAQLLTQKDIVQMKAEGYTGQVMRTNVGRGRGRWGAVMQANHVLHLPGHCRECR